MRSLPEKREQLEQLERALDEIGGRNIPLAETIDELRAEIEQLEAGREWTRPQDAMPPQEPPICGYTQSAPVLVSDGYQIQHAYAQLWDDEEGPTWFLVGRDQYHAGDVLYWRALPPLPELPTKD